VNISSDFLFQFSGCELTDFFYCF